MTGKVFDAKGAGAYYDDDAVAKFYALCWGGADIHIGLYASGHESVADASAAMTQHLLAQAGIRAGQRVLDIACGFGGTLRRLARLGCTVKGIDIAANSVARAREANTEAGLADRIEVAVGDFHAIDSPDDAWDAVVCQEAIIHSPDRPQVFREVCRVLRPGGVFAFSDILTGEHADLALVEAAFARLGASVGATPADYAAMAGDAGFEIVHREERPNDIRTHYDKLAEQLEGPLPELPAEAAASIRASIRRWQAALVNGDITWACFVARKPG